MTDALDEDVAASPAVAAQDAAAAVADADLIAATDALCAVLARETALARTGGLAAFAQAVRDKRTALARFVAATEAVRAAAGAPSEAGRAALRRLRAVADENALVLDAVRTTIDDFAARLRRALTSAADPGTYGPAGRGPRHALAAQVDTRI
jgi:hypothetical protein